MRPLVSIPVAIFVVMLGLSGWLEAQTPPPTGAVPTFSGKGKVTEAVNTDTGAVFDIGRGITMAFPKGLPVGRSRLVTLELAKNIPVKLIPGFKPIGPALSFTGAFSTSEKPIVVALASSKAPAVSRGSRLVLAMEIGTFCDQSNSAFKVNGGLCSGFELSDAQYEASSKRVVASLNSTGGLRMQFGVVPAAP